MNKNLIRYPKHLQQENLFAWSSADELLLNHVRELSGIEKKKILIINDQFGAIAANLSDLNIEVYVDSFISAKSININSQNKIEALRSLSDCKSADLVLCYLPKNNNYFEDILCRLTQILDKGTPFVFTGMVKHISKGHFKLIEKYIGELSTSLAVKKARLIFSSFNGQKSESLCPKEIKIEGFDNSFTHFSNIFSIDKLDIGTRFFLENMPRGIIGNILDLGCGNGILGIKAKLLNPNSVIYFSDESYMAIMSAKENYQKYSFSDEAHYFWTHSMEGVEDEMDLILCNPPFHQGTTIGTHIAIDMFKSSFKSLKKGGVLRVVANSHLGYHVQLKNIFKNYKLINSNKKFVIYESIKQ